ncbi:MAG: hypothetical protein Kow00105_15090 [Phycisphaeraceae bacterium]
MPVKIQWGVLFMMACLLGTSQAGADLKLELEQVRDKYDLPALGAVVIRDGIIAEPCVVGTLSLKSTISVPADARWHLGSCGKSMTAMLTALMVERKLLRWDTTLKEALAGTGIRLHERYEQVAIEQLLGHRAGLGGDLTQRPIWVALRLAGGSGPTQRRMITQSCLFEAPATEPGTTFTYANEGYVIVGYILEHLTGKPFEQLMEDELFRPLGLASAGFGPPEGKSDPLGHMNRAVMKPGWLADNPPGLSPAGRMHMSLADWAKYAQVHLRAARGESYALISKASYTRLHTPLPGQDYALGWGCIERDWAGGRVLVHAGSNSMWFAFIEIVPARNAAVLIVTNSGTPKARAAVKEIRDYLIGILGFHEGADGS